MDYRYKAQACMASAFISFLSASSAGVSIFPVSTGLLDRFDGSIDRSKDFVDAAVDVDLVDIASFSETEFIGILVRFGEAVAGVC